MWRRPLGPLSESEHRHRLPLHVDEGLVTHADGSVADGVAALAPDAEALPGSDEVRIPPGGLDAE